MPRKLAPCELPSAMSSACGMTTGVGASASVHMRNTIGGGICGHSSHCSLPPSHYSTVDRCSASAFCNRRRENVDSILHFSKSSDGRDRSNRRKGGGKGGGLFLNCGKIRKLRISAIDAAQEFDYEHMKKLELRRQNKLKVGIVGFGNFGQFLAQRFVKQGHDVLAHSRSDYSEAAEQLGVTYFRDADDFCEEHPDVVVLCTSILSTELVLRALPVQRLKRSTLFVDVLSVKEFPRNLLLTILPPEFDVLCTHPMFGPESGSGSWSGLPFVFDRVRIRQGPRSETCAKLLSVFENEGCRMVEMTCEEHDRHAAGSQFITHTVGRVLGSLGLESTAINTKGYESLLKLVDNTYSDSFDLYYGLFLYNVSAIEELGRLERAFDTVKSQLLNKLHGVLRQQMLSTNRPMDSRSHLPPPPTVSAYFAPSVQSTSDVGGQSSKYSENNVSRN